MATNKKPKKRRTQIVRLHDPLAYVLAGVRPAPSDYQTKLSMKHHLAMQSLTKGIGTRTDWQIVAESLNVSLAIAQLGRGKEFVPEIELAQSAMLNIMYRSKDTGQMTFKGLEIAAVNDILGLHDEQIAQAPLIEVTQAVRNVIKALASGQYATMIQT